MAEAPGGRRLRAWLVAQLESGRFPGLEWDDAGRTALRIPWQHGGKGGARGGAGAALCRAWAEYKGRVAPGAGHWDAAGCKTRLRCALHKSPEFQEEPSRSRLRGSRPYKVYRLLLPPPPRGERRGAHRDGAPQAPESSGDKAAEAAESGTERAPPPSPLSLSLESSEPLPPNEGPLRLLVSLWRGGGLSWQGWLPRGEYLLSLPLPAEASRLPSPLPRLVLRGAQLGGAGAEGGLLLSSGPRGIFVRARRGARGPRWRAPHGPRGEGRLEPAELLLLFDSRRFQEELRQHRAGLGPLPEHRVTLVLGQEPAPPGQTHGRDLVLQLEQAFAKQLLDAASAPPSPTAAPPLPTASAGCPAASPKGLSPQ
ncbi:interferon regulatory factor 9 isoform X2 [Phaenicophaeus curvirostris]|uniref:interferon regulatory factor 9 isoform X2 n=1 Tax=Phaenicophaeus curvirostris TaxID=33595 RepID=UPI0037F0CB72